MWKEGEVVVDWKNAEVVPIPKKGLQCCANWHGISLLDFEGKVFFHSHPGKAAGN